MTIQTVVGSTLQVMPGGIRSAKPAEHLALVDGHTILGHADGSVCFSGRTVHAHRGPLVEFRRFGNLLLTAGRDGFAMLWDATGRPLLARKHPTGPLCAATFTDGTLVLADDKGIVFAWDLHTRTTDWIGDVRAPVTSMVGTDGIITMGTADGTVHWDGQSEQRHQGEVLSIFSVGRGEVVTVGEDGRVRLGSELLIRVSGNVRASSLYGRTLLLAIDREVQQWDLRRRALVRRTTATSGEIADVELSAHGAWVLLEGERSPRLWS